MTFIALKKCLRAALLLAVSLIWLATTAAWAHDQPDQAIPNPRPVCAFGDLLFDTDFEGARINQCTQTGPNQYSLVTYPEAKPINSSPWYAFKVISERARTIEVYLHYAHHKHRYPPKISTNGRDWSALDKNSYKAVLDGKAIKMKLRVGKTPTYIAAQELIDNQFYSAWIKNLSETHAFVQQSVLGKSKQGRPVIKMEVAESGNEWVLLVSRQHPPEVTGALAFLPFVERVLAEDALGQQFRRRFNLLIVPNLNPDGVAAGHWRFNLNYVDLNRDWGIYKQPEIALVGAWLDRLLSDTRQRLVLGLDFHSTKEDVFYTQSDDANIRLPHFTRDWMAAIQAQVPEFKVNRKATHNAGLPTFKTYISQHYGIPAITYEMGDHTDRPLIIKSAKAAAEQMMRLLLLSDKP